MKYLKLIAILFAIILLANACAKTEPVEKPHTIDEKFLQSLPRITAKTENIQQELKLTGRIVPDEAKQASVYALVSGRISQVNVELGDYVQKGQTLAILKSAEVAGVNNELALAKSNLQIAKKNMDSYEELYNGKLIAEREYISAKAEYQKALSELEKAQHIASISGGENSAYIVKAPLTGYIIAKNITNNSEVRSDMSEPLFAIADLSEVWVLANVFEVDIQRIHLGQIVTVHTLSNPEKTYQGKIDKIYNVLDPETRSMKIRASLNNSGKEFMPGMFVSVKVDVNENRKAVAVPSSCIAFEDNQNFVIVLNKDNKPQIRKIQEIYRSGDKCYVEGVEEDETIITSSQIFLYQALSNE